MVDQTASNASLLLTRICVALAGLALATVLGAPALTAPTADANSVKHPSALPATRTLNAADTAHLRYVRGSGSLLLEEGAATGSLPGKMLVRCEVGPTVSASFTIFVRGGGTIDGRGTAKTHGASRYESFGGSLTVTSGTGRYAHAHGHAGLYGVFDRRTYALTVQTTGRLLY
jgi:hypothetical protein